MGTWRMFGDILPSDLAKFYEFIIASYRERGILAEEELCTKLKEGFSEKCPAQ